MPWWAHSRKATLSRVYAVKSVDPFCLVDVPAKFGPVFNFLEGFLEEAKLMWKRTGRIENITLFSTII
jgi:hypothetical protein